MKWVVAAWEPPTVTIYSSYHDSWASLPSDGILYVRTPAGRIAGHDHYWLEDDGTVGYEDHHDYDEPEWWDTYIEPELPSDRRVLDGGMAPDWVAEELNLG